MSANNLCSFFRSCYDDCVQADAVFSWRPDAGVLEAGRGQSRRKTRASWRPDAGAPEARRGQSGRKTRALWRQDAGRRGVKLFLGSTVLRRNVLIQQCWMTLGHHCTGLTALRPNYKIN